LKFVVTCSGRFGFQREMNALSSLESGNKEDGENVNALLHSTQEIEQRVQQICRWWRLWRPDVLRGWVTLGRFKVGGLFGSWGFKPWVWPVVTSADGSGCGGCTCYRLGHAQPLQDLEFSWFWV
jgi:hypothetical protein